MTDGGLDPTADAAAWIQPGAVRAAGALVWRAAERGLEVALVHRPRYGDWSWPKGKLDDGESWAGACVREVREETGLQVRIGLPLPHATYVVGTSQGLRTKVVRYWAAQVDTDEAPRDSDDEVDEVAWLGVDEAAARLDYQRDRHQLRALVRAQGSGEPGTWPLAVVRHAKSVPRTRWKGEDRRRPLDDNGAVRARAIVPVLAAYGLRRLVSSPSARCEQTLAPYASAVGARVRVREGLSEEGYEDDPSSAAAVVDRVLETGAPTALCSHRPVLPALLQTLAAHCQDGDLAQALLESAGPGMVKGEVLVAHVRGVGADAVVVAAERHDTR